MLLTNHARRPTTFLAATFALSLSCVLMASGQQSLTDAQVGIVVQRLAEGATHSWELGTRMQALIELDTPAFSVFNNSKVPPSMKAPSTLDTVLGIAASVVSNRAKATGGASGPQPLVVNDGSAADPASNGVGVLLANWTGQSNSSINFGQAATDQINYLFSQVPRTSDGAFSHRTEQVQLWSDFVYMVPPFLSYYGVVTQNRSMLEEGYNQIKLYRNYLHDTNKTANNLWKHIVMGNGTDGGHWSTGNGWAAAGMLRVLGTIKNSQYANSMKNEQKDLTNWVKEIHDGMYSFIRSDGLFNNYADNSSTFADASSAALLASTVYRMSLLTNTHTHLPNAERVRQTIFSSIGGNSAVNSSSLAGLAHFTSDGWLQPVVNPDSFGAQGQNSPEGQAFVVELHSAWRDWSQNGAVGANSAKGNALAPSKVTVGVVSAIISALTSGWLGTSADTDDL